jgi:serine/threonine-protein kinase HipA
METMHPRVRAIWDNAMDLDLARSVAPYFRVPKKLADEIIKRSQAVARQWPKIADSLGVRPREKERMAVASRLAG